MQSGNTVMKSGNTVMKSGNTVMKSGLTLMILESEKIDLISDKRKISSEAGVRVVLGC
jgi:hypothetical protein